MFLLGDIISHSDKSVRGEMGLGLVSKIKKGNYFITWLRLNKKEKVNIKIINQNFIRIF